MLDYIFFHRQSQDGFVNHLVQQGLNHETRDDEMGLIVSVDDDLPDETVDALDDVYDRLMEEAEQLLSDNEEMADAHVAGLNITLADGSVTSATVPPELLNRILGAISIEELNQLIEAVVSSVENPGNRPLCQR